MRVSRRLVLVGAILTLAGCQGYNERVSYVNYDGYTGADFATAGADGVIDVVAVGAPHQGVTPKGAARQIAEAMTGANFGPSHPISSTARRTARRRLPGRRPFWSSARQWNAL